MWRYTSEPLGDNDDDFLIATHNVFARDDEDDYSNDDLDSDDNGDNEREVFTGVQLNVSRISLMHEYQSTMLVRVLKRDRIHQLFFDTREWKVGDSLWYCATVHDDNYDDHDDHNGGRDELGN